MEKSNYEIYAEQRQKELLQEKRSLNHCILWLKHNKETFSDPYIESQIELVASVFGLQINEVERAMNGEKYWCI